MKPLRTRLQEARRRLGTPWEVLERDYLLSWMLVGIGEIPVLRDTLAFKGGTALKKCYFGNYRFSEDLDFSGLDGVPTGEAMARSVGKACEAAGRLLNEYAPVEITCDAIPSARSIRQARRPSQFAPGYPGIGNRRCAS